MKVRAKNVEVQPVYWAHLHKWPYGVVVEYDVSADLYEAIKDDPRIAIVADEPEAPRVLIPDAPVRKKGK